MSKRRKRSKSKSKLTPAKIRAREAFKKRSQESETATSGSAEFRTALSDVLQGDKRKEVIEVTGLPFNRLARLSSGAIPPAAHEVKALETAADIIGYKFPKQANG